MEQLKKDHESELGQRLQFIEALLLDKDSLSSKYDKLLGEVKVRQIMSHFSSGVTLICNRYFI